MIPVPRHDAELSEGAPETVGERSALLAEAQDELGLEAITDSDLITVAVESEGVYEFGEGITHTKRVTSPGMRLAEEQARVAESDDEDEEEDEDDDEAVDEYTSDDYVEDEEEPPLAEEPQWTSFPPEPKPVKPVDERLLQPVPEPPDAPIFDDKRTWQQRALDALSGVARDQLELALARAHVTEQVASTFDVEAADIPLDIQVRELRRYERLVRQANETKSEMPPPLPVVPAPEKRVAMWSGILGAQVTAFRRVAVDVRYIRSEWSAYVGSLDEFVACATGMTGRLNGAANDDTIIRRRWYAVAFAANERGDRWWMLSRLTVSRSKARGQMSYTAPDVPDGTWFLQGMLASITIQEPGGIKPLRVDGPFLLWRALHGLPRAIRPSSEQFVAALQAEGGPDQVRGKNAGPVWVLEPMNRHTVDNNQF